MSFRRVRGMLKFGLDNTKGYLPMSSRWHPQSRSLYEYYLNTVHFKFNTFFSLRSLDSSLVLFKVYALLFSCVVSDYALCIKCSLYHLRYFTVLLRTCSILIHFLCISLFTISSSVTILYTLVVLQFISLMSIRFVLFSSFLTIISVSIRYTLCFFYSHYILSFLYAKFNHLWYPSV